MFTGAALFPGRDAPAQLRKIYRVLGTPSEEEYPGLKALEDYDPATIPQYPAKEWSEICPQADETGLDLLSRMLVYNPDKRISAIEALRHPFFDGVAELEGANVDAVPAEKRTD